MKQLNVIVILLLLGISVRAQVENSNVKAIIGATVVDLEGKKDISNAVVVVTGDRISAVGGADEVEVPANAERIDASGKWLIPGLLNMHVHLGLVLPGKMEAELAHETEGELTLRMAANARETLLAGVTTVRLTGDPKHGDLALKKAIAKGQAIGPRIFSAGEALAITGGHGAEKGMTFYDGPYELIKATRKEISAGATWIKILISGGISTNGGDIAEPLMTPEEIEAVIDAAHRFGAKVTAHSGSPVATHVALDAGIDCIEHGYFLDRDVIKKMKERGAWYVPTILVSSPSIDAFLEEIGTPDWFIKRKESVGKDHWNALVMAIEEKVNIALGSDQMPAYPTDGTTATVREAEYYVEAGMSPLQVLRVATIEPAKMLGAENEIGSIEVGKYADMLIVPGNPTENISELREIEMVMKGGEVYRSSLDQ